jgi:hypothetical protein
MVYCKMFTRRKYGVHLPRVSSSIDSAPCPRDSWRVISKQNSLLRSWLDCVHLSKIFFSRSFSKKIIFSRNSREIRETIIEIQISFFYTFGILTTKMTTKMCTKLASIEINDEILSKVGRIRKNLGKNV